jgi:hypothetical protein
MGIQTDRTDFVETILNMPYGQLKQIAHELAETIKDKGARPKLETAEEFADLLWDWADANRADDQ